MHIGRRGIYHDLEEIFHRVNEAYFDCAIDATITWGKRPNALSRRTSIQLGSYHPNKRLITIHPVLDQAIIPRLCVERIVHHEMLHQHLPAEKKRGQRRQIHTPEFRRAEALFHHAERADRWFKDNLDLLLAKKMLLTS